MMRLLIAGLLVIAAAAPLSAQRSEPASPESIRPQDTEPSIPVTSPTIDPRAAPPRAAPTGSGAAGSLSDGAQSDPNTPVSSPGAAEPGMEPGAEPGRSAGAGTGGTYGADDQTRSAGLPAGALPERASSPRTLRAHAHVYIAFAVVWALLFGYAISLGRRFSRLEDEVRRLRG